MRRMLALALATTTLGFAASSCNSSPQAPAAQSEANVSAVADAKAAMRKLWEDHITWTRVYIIDALAGLPDTDAAAGRLLKNQEDIGAAVASYYGKDAGDKLTALLKDHIMIATEVLKAAKAGDDTQVAAQQKAWSANADEIADFLSGANPNLDRAAIRNGLQKHLDYTTQEVVDRLQKDWTGDIAAYDANHEHMLMFSDTLTDAIAKQFPEKFGG